MGLSYLQTFRGGKEVMPVEGPSDYPELQGVPVRTPSQTCMWLYPLGQISLQFMNQTARYLLAMDQDDSSKSKS